MLFGWAFFSPAQPTQGHPVGQSAKEDPKAPLSLPIQNRRVLRGAALSPPDAAQGPLC